MLLLYDLGIFLYTSLIRAAALFHPKARLWVEGREGLFEKIAAFRKENSGRLVWVHCASLGEFEQGRPLIEKLKEQDPGVRIALSFYSPSGYEIRKNYKHADGVFYLPADTRRKAQKFIDTLQPDAAVFVKYEFWYHHLKTLHSQDIPTYLISAIFNKKQIFFKSYGSTHRKMLGFFSRIFVQNSDSEVLLKNLGQNKVTVCGDTRIDRVSQIPAQERVIQEAVEFSKNHKVLVCGSTWGPDEKLLAKLIASDVFADWKCIIAPHETDAKHIEKTEELISAKVVRFSAATSERLAEAKVLVIDNIGMLSSLYKYGDIAYIGGGFGAGIHNTLEPAAFGLPIIFGPKYQKFQEAVDFKEQGAGFPISDANELRQAFLSLQDKEKYTKASKAAVAYIERNKGATETILKYLL